MRRLMRPEVKKLRQLEKEDARHGYRLIMVLRPTLRLDGPAGHRLLLVLGSLPSKRSNCST